MIEAIFGIIGVVVGGLLTGTVGFLGDRHRERRAARTSARIVREHLLDSALRVEDAIARQDVNPQSSTDALAAVWRDERRTLASAMGYREYAKVLAGVRAATRVPRQINEPDEHERDAQLHALLPQLGDALHALLRMAEDRPAGGNRWTTRR